MWEEIKTKQKDKDSRFLLEWLDRVVLQPKYLNAAEDIFLSVSQKVPEVGLCRRTPQSAPWHTEGPTVADGIVRMLAAILAIVDGETLFDVEEFKSHKDLFLEIKEMEETIRERAATLEAYSCIHDIAKPKVVTFSAPPGSRGEREGFTSGRQPKTEDQTEHDMALYLKLFRAFEAKHTNLNKSELMAAFYDEYEISIHYWGHAGLGASDEFLEAREAVADFFRLTETDRVLLTFMTRYHMDVLDFFKISPNEKKFELMVSRANKFGLDGDDALDAMLAATFLDSTVGSLVYQDNDYLVRTEAIFNWLYSEQRAVPLRRLRRAEAASRAQKKKIMQVLAEAKLSPEEVFELLEVGIGPERGRVMEEIYALVQDRTRTIDFKDKTGLIASQIETARNIFDQSHNS